MGSHSVNTTPQLSGVIGFFNDSQTLIEATKKVRALNYESIDTFTPYPVHGLEHAQGLRRSPLPYITFTFGLAGVSCAFLLQYWTSKISWAINVGGKPFNSWPAFVPVMFELTILFAGISTVVGMILLNRLPNLSKKIADKSLTNNRFALFIEAVPHNDVDDLGNEHPKSFKKFDEAEAMNVLQSAGALDVKKLYSEAWF